MLDNFDQVDQELVVAIADLQERIAAVAQTLNLAGFAANGLAFHADRRGDVFRVHGCEKAAERLRQAAGYVQSAAVLLRMIEQPDEWTQEHRSPAPAPEGPPAPAPAVLGSVSAATCCQSYPFCSC